MPGAKEDVVLCGWLVLVWLERREEGEGAYLSVRRADVAHFAQRGDFGFYFVGERDGGEDGEVAGCQAHCRSKRQFFCTVN